MSLHSENMETLLWFRAKWARERRSRLVEWADREIAEKKKQHAAWLAWMLR